MFGPANQTHFALTIEGLGNDLQVLSLQGREAISQPFVFEVELVSEQPSLDKAGAVLTPTQVNTPKRNAPFCEECEKCKAGACAI